MSHFYRLITVYGDYEKPAHPDVEHVSSYRPSGKNGMLPVDWLRDMEGIPMSPPWPHCKILRAPNMPAGFEQRYSIFRVLNSKAQFLDIYSGGERALVSQRAKEVLEACDDFEHEYIETEIQDEQHQRINQEPYYLLNVRRILKIDNLGGKVQNWEKMFAPSGRERKYLPTIQQSKELKEIVAEIPLWRHFMNEEVIYLSEPVLKALRDADITGLRDYSNTFGNYYEAIARFE